LCAAHPPPTLSNVCSDHREYRSSPAPAISAYGWTRPEGPPARPVWVDLEQLCRHDPATAATVIDGLDLTGRAPGMLQRWRRSGRGDWLGVVHYSVGYIDGRHRRELFTNQLVPAYVLQPRHNDQPLL
jgi:hypothetical protein